MSHLYSGKFSLVHYKLDQTKRGIFDLTVFKNSISHIRGHCSYLLTKSRDFRGNGFGQASTGQAGTEGGEGMEGGQGKNAGIKGTEKG